MFAGLEVFALVGFLFAAYSTVANDAIQTLGTFLSSNSHRRWQILWIYGSSVIVAVMLFGYFVGETDIAFDRLNKIPFPKDGIEWWHVMPPLVLIFLTRFGIPVSTTFLVLTIFTLSGAAAGATVFTSMLTKSGVGYILALGLGFLVYATVAKGFERWIYASPRESHNLTWTIVQWISTAFLWSQWLIQDLANIFVFLPRTTQTIDGVTAVSFSPGLIAFATVVMVVLLGIVFATRGGEIQKIVLSKTSTTDVRAATLVDIIYGLILLVFKEYSDIPMSTTWVFLGLIAGREIAVSYVAGLRDRAEAFKDVWTDAVRALIGLVISVVLAVGLPWLSTGAPPAFLAG